MNPLQKTAALAMAGAVTLSALPGALAQQPQAWAREAQPNADGNYNILFLTTDQEHAFTQYPEGTSYLARALLAELGTTFEKHYICSNMSTSSRSVIYTGTHITDTHMYDNTDFAWQQMLDPAQITVGDRMQAAGYHTAYAGKWHMGDGSILSSGAETVTDLQGYGFEEWDWDHDCIGAVQEGHETDPGIAANSVQWLTEQGAALNRAGQSFFLAVNFVNPHDIMNYNADETFRGAMMKTGGAPEDDLYKTTYAWPVAASWNQNLADGTLPLAIDRYNRGWTSPPGAL